MGKHNGKARKTGMSVGKALANKVKMVRNHARDPGDVRLRSMQHLDGKDSFCDRLKTLYTNRMWILQVKCVL